MADARRDVSISINVIGDAVGKFNNIAKGLNSIATALDPIVKNVDTAANGINKLGTALQPLKDFKAPDLKTLATGMNKLAGVDPTKIKEFTAAFKELSKVKVPESLAKAAEALKAFSSIGKIPDIAKFVTALNELSKVKGLPIASLEKTSIALQGFSAVKGLPSASITKLATGLQSLSAIKGISSANLLRVAEALKQFSGIKDLPRAAGITSLAAGIKSLSGFKTTNAVALGQLAGVLRSFAGVTRFPNVSQFAAGLQRLAAVDVSSFRNIAQSISNLAYAMARLNSVTVNTGAFNAVAQGAQSASQGINQMGQSAIQAAGSYGKLLNSIRRYSIYRAIADTVIYLKEQFTAGLQEIVAYDQGLKDLQAITNATSTEVAQMGKVVRDVASNTKFSVGEVADGMRTLSQAGFTAQESMQTMGAVADLATGTLSDMSLTVDLVTTAMRVFDIQAGQSSHVVDVFANAINRSKLTVDKLRVAMNYVGPVARDAGITFEELSAAMATLANSGLRASTIGTGLRRVFSELLDPTAKFRGVIDQAGMTVEAFDPRVNSLSTVIGNLRFALQDSSDALKAFGKWGASAALALVDATNGYDQMLSVMNESGAAARMASTQMEGLGVKIKNFNDKVKVLFVEIGRSGLTDAFKVLVDLGRGLLDVLINLAGSGFGKFIIRVTAAAAIIGTLATVLVSATASLAAYRMAVIASNTATAAFLTTLKGAAIAIRGPFMLAVLAITGATIAIESATSFINRYKKEAQEAADATAAFGSALDTVNNYFKSTSGFVAGSKEMIDANIQLKKSLLETADAFGKEVGYGYNLLSILAYNAANSINSLTGEIEHSGEAITRYQSKLAAIKMDNLVRGYEAASDHLKEMGEGLTYYWNLAKSVGTFAFGFANKDEFGATIELTDALRKYNAESLSFESLLEKAADLRTRRYDSLSGQEKDLLHNIAMLSEYTQKWYKELSESGKVDMSMTEEEVTSVLTALGASEEKLKAFIYYFNDAKKIAAGMPKTGIEGLREELADGTLKVEEFASMYKELGGVIPEQDAAFIASQKEKKEELLRQIDALDLYEKQMRAVGKWNQEIANQQAIERAKLTEQLHALYRADAKNFTAASIMKVASIKKEYEQTKAEYEKIFADSDKLLERKLSELAVQYNKDVQAALRAPFNADTIVSMFEDSNAEILEINRDRLYQIDLLEAEGVLTKEQSDAKRLESELEFYRQSLAAAEDYFTQIQEHGFKEGDDEYVKAQEEVNKVREKSVEVVRKATIEAVRLESDSRNKIKDINEKIVEDIKTFSEERKKVDEKYKDDREQVEKEIEATVEKIHTDLNKKLADLAKERTDNEQKAAESIEGINNRVDNSLRDIRQRGMTDEEKDADNRAAYQEKMAKAAENYYDAVKTGNMEALESSKAYYEEAYSLAEGFERDSDAAAGVMRVGEELKKIVELEKQLAEQAIDAEAYEARAEAASAEKKALDESSDKLSELKEGYDEVIKKEDDRHTKEMANLETELAKWKEKLQVAQQMQGSLSAESTGSAPVGGSATDNAATNQVEAYKKAQQELINVQNDGIQKIEQAGETVYTNIQDAASRGMDAAVEEVKEGLEIPIGMSEEETKALLDSITEDINNANVSIEPEVDDSSIDEAIAKLDDMDGRTTYSTHIIKQVVQAAAATGGLVSDLVQRFASGGQVFKRLADRFITAGSGFIDDVPALLKKNEFVQSEPAVSFYGKDFMRALNARLIPKHMLPRFSMGGLVEDAVGSLRGLVDNIPMPIPAGAGTSSSGSGVSQVVQFDILPNRPNINANMSKFDIDELFYQLEQMKKYRA
jgi:TP901 family phage tail tape measure protein